MLDIKVFWRESSEKESQFCKRGIRAQVFEVLYKVSWVIGVSVQKENTWNTYLSPSVKKLWDRASKGNYILVSKSRRQLELKAPKIQSNLFLITSDDRGGRVSFCVSVYVLVCLPRVTVDMCLHIVCWLVFCGSLYTSQNKGNVSNYSGFHLVDAL